MSDVTRVNMKVTTIGDGAVGKTSILTSYTYKNCPDKYDPTVFDTYVASIEFKTTKRNFFISLTLADTAGQEDYEALRHLCYPGTDIFLITFALNDRQSFTNIKSKWARDVFDPAKVKSSLGCPIIIVGNKLDLRNGGTPNCVTREEGESLVNVLKEMAPKDTNITYMESSATEYIGIKEIFDSAVRHQIAQIDASRPSKSKCSIL